MHQAWSLGGLSAITHQGLSWCQRQHSAPTSLITMTRRPFTGSGKGVHSEGWPPRFFFGLRSNRASASRASSTQDRSAASVRRSRSPISTAGCFWGGVRPGVLPWWTTTQSVFMHAAASGPFLVRRLGAPCLDWFQPKACFHCRRVNTRKRFSHWLTRRRSRGGTSCTSWPSSRAASRCRQRTSTDQSTSASRISRAQLRAACQRRRPGPREHPGGIELAGGLGSMGRETRRSAPAWPDFALLAAMVRLAGLARWSGSLLLLLASECLAVGDVQAVRGSTPSNGSTGSTTKESDSTSRSLKRRHQAPRTGSFQRKPASLARWRSA